MTIITVISVLLLSKYCEMFSLFGKMAKARLQKTPELVFIITPIFFWISAYLCRKYARSASGNSILHVNAALQETQNDPVDKAKIFKDFNFKVIVVKAVSSLLCCFGGGALGREGPSVHMSAAFFAIVGNRFRKSLPKIGLETWVCAGSAIGMIVAFHAPISGFVFVLEKLIKLKIRKFKSFFSWLVEKIMKLRAPNLRNTIIGVVVVTLIYKYLNASYHMFAFTSYSFEVSVTNVLLVFLTAILSGFFVVMFKIIGYPLHKKIADMKSNYWHLAPIIAGLAVASTSLYGGIYSFSGGVFTANQALANTELILSYPEVIARIVNTMLTFISGCAGGLVAPSIAIGSGIGSIIASMISSADANVFILIGIVAFLSGILGEPITAAIVIYETTGESPDVIPLLLCVSFTTHFALKFFEKIVKKIGLSHCLNPD